jgi:hypothetical protein
MIGNAGLEADGSIGLAFKVSTDAFEAVKVPLTRCNTEVLHSRDTREDVKTTKGYSPYRAPMRDW